MAEPQYQSTVNGQEVQQADLNLLGTTGGLSDDRVIAELTRLVVYDTCGAGAFDTNLHMLVWTMQLGVSGLGFAVDGAAQIVAPTTGLAAEAGTTGYYLGRALDSGTTSHDWYATWGIAGIASAPQLAAHRTYIKSV